MGTPQTPGRRWGLPKKGRRKPGTPPGRRRGSQKFKLSRDCAIRKVSSVSSAAALDRKLTHGCRLPLAWGPGGNRYHSSRGMTLIGEPGKLGKGGKYPALHTHTTKTFPLHNVNSLHKAGWHIQPYTEFNLLKKKCH